MCKPCNTRYRVLLIPRSVFVDGRSRQAGVGAVQPLHMAVHVGHVHAFGKVPRSYES